MAHDPGCHRVTAGYVFSAKEVITAKKLNQAVGDICINLNDILGDITNIFNILDQLLNPPGGFGLVGYTLEQGTPTPSNGPLGHSMGNVNLVLPAQRKWTLIRVVSTFVLGSSNRITFRTIRVNAVDQSGVSSMNVGLSYFTGNSDDSHTLVHVYEFIPNPGNLQLTLSILARYSDVSIGAANFPNFSIYAIGYHEAIIV